MLTPTHAKKSFTANRVFTDREDARDLFSAAIGETDTQDSYKVLMWYGVGGQGKSALLRELDRMARAFNEVEAEKKADRTLIPAKIDFDDERLKRIDAALYSIRLQLAQGSGFSFHTFDTAFIAYYKKTRPGIDIATAFPELFKGEREGMMDLIDVLDGPLSIATDLASAALPGANLLYKWGARLTGKLASWWKSRGNEVLAGIEHLQPEQLLERLPSYLGIDICDGIKAKPKLRPVILVDTYEALWRDRGQKDGLADRRTDAWVRLLVQDAPGVLFVIAGRDKLRWGEIDEAWNGVIDAHLLGGLSDEDADLFLTQVPIDDAAIREVIVSSSNGLPFYLDLQVSQYEAMREQGGTPVAEQFGGTPSDILARFLEHLSEADQGALRLASYLQIITRPVMDALAEAFPGRAINYSFDQMVSRSSFVEISENTFEIHALMKEELQRREKAENEERYKKTHRWLFEFYEDKFKKWLPADAIDVGETLFSSSFHHLLQTRSDQAFKWLFENDYFIEQLQYWSTLRDTYLRAIDAIGADDRNKKDLVRAKLKLGVVCDNLGFDAEATAILRELSSQSNTQTDAAIKAGVCNNLAHILTKEGKTEEAETLFKESLALLEAETDKMPDNLATVLVSLGENLVLQGRFEEALPLFLRAASELSNDGFLHDSWRVCFLLSETYGLLEQHAAAVAMHYKGVDHYNRAWVAAESDNDGNEKQRYETILSYQWRSSLSGHLWSRTRFEYLPRVFSTTEHGPIVHSKKDTECFQLLPDKETRELFADGQLQNGDLSHFIVEHPNQALLKSSLEDALSKTNVGSLFLQFFDAFNLGPFFFAGGFLDGFTMQNNTKLYLVCPEDNILVKSQQVLIAIAELRRLDLILAGHEEPDYYADLMEHAGYHHGRNLDLLRHISMFINEHDEEDRNRYLACLSESMTDFVNKEKSEMNSDDLYDIYAVLFGE